MFLMDWLEGKTGVTRGQSYKLQSFASLQLTCDDERSDWARCDWRKEGNRSEEVLKSQIDLIKRVRERDLKLLHHLLKKTGPTPACFSFIFGRLKQTIQFLPQINVKKCQIHPVYGAGIQTRDLTFASSYNYPIREPYKMFIPRCQN